jgi:hypothetical protein
VVSDGTFSVSQMDACDGAVPEETEAPAKYRTNLKATIAY